MALASPIAIVTLGRELDPKRKRPDPRAALVSDAEGRAKTLPNQAQLPNSAISGGDAGPRPTPLL
jgi:hypothetical protein